MIRYIQFSLFLCLSLTVAAQKEWSNWYFTGNSLLTFKHGYAEPVNNFVNPIPPFTDWYNFYNFGYGGISYSDPLTGNMKFIVSNRTAFSSNYEDMPNENFIKSCPDKYSYHIIPFHNDKNKFYILQFQSAFADLLQHESGLQVRCPNAVGLAYTMVDLSLNNGQGNYYDVNTGIAGGFTDLITTVRHANGKDVWVIVHPYNSNQYSAILITDDGIKPAVNSTAGPYIGGSSASMIGTLTASHDGKVLASYFSYTNSKTIQLYQFNNATGVITDNAILPTTEFIPRMQFSPDNSKLYTICSDGLIQYDFNQTNVAASRTVIYNEQYSSFYDMQLAPDGKIYVAKTTAIENGNYNEYTGAIQCPNLPQYAANFNPKALSILPTNFPDLINDFIQDPKADPITRFSLGKDTSICFGSYTIKAPDGWESYRWNTGETTKEINVKKAGLYYVLTGNTGFSCPSGYGYVNITDKSTKLNLGADTMLCPGSPYLLHINNDYTNITWQNNSHNRDSFITTSNQYIISANDANGCYTSDSIGIYFKQYPQASFGGDTTLCNNQPLKLSLLPEKSPFYAATYAWQDDSKNDSYTVTKSGSYWGTVTYDGCTASDTIKVAYITADRVHLGNDTTLCSGDSLQVMADVSNATYLWNTGETTQSIYVETPGYYYVFAGNGNCTVTDTIEINMVPKPVFTIGNDTVLCMGQKMVLSSFQYADKYKWQDGSVVSSYEATVPGLYWLQLTQNGCSASDSIKIDSKPLPIVSLGKDTGFCKDSSIILNAYNPNAKSYLWGDGSTGELYQVTSGGQYTVQVTGKNGCVAADTVLITVTDPPVFSLGKDTILCQNSKLNYSFNVSNASYLWSNGSTLPYQTISQEGDYWFAITRQGCTSADSIEIKYKPSPFLNLGNDTVLCEGVTKLLDATNQGATYQWQDNSGSPTYEVHKAGLYFVKASTDGCSTSDSISIKYTPKPLFNLGSDLLLCKGTSALLNPLMNTTVNYLWQDGSTKSSYEAHGEGLYTLIATNGCGALKDSITITSELCKINMPSAFTPNKDGLNDIFKVKYPFPVKQFHMVIYNRFGQKLFESYDITKGWNGTINSIDQDAGTYIWIISLVDAGGKSETAQGTVTLIR